MVPGRDYIGVGAGGILSNGRQQILLLRRNKEPEVGKWSIPGGAIEYGENVEDALTREMREEIGMRCDISLFLGFCNYILPDRSRHWISLFFVVEALDAGCNPMNMEPDKHSDMRWFDLDALPEELTSNTQKAIALYKKRCK